LLDRRTRTATVHLASLVDLESGHESHGASAGSRSVQPCPRGVHGVAPTCVTLIGQAIVLAMPETPSIRGARCDHGVRARQRHYDATEANRRAPGGAVDGHQPSIPIDGWFLDCLLYTSDAADEE